MIIFVLGVIAVILFVVGIALVFQGYRNIPDANTIVSKDAFDKVKSDFDNSKEEEEKLKQQLDSLTIKLEKTKEKLAQAQESGEGVDALKAQEEEYKTKIQELEKNLGFLREKADTQATESINVISSLREKNETLESEIVSTKGQVDPDALEVLSKEKESLESQVNKHLSRVQQLEGEMNTVTSLTEQNRKLTEGLKQITEKISELEDEILKSSPSAGKNAEKIKEINENLIEREKLLQLKLTQSRAQATGLDAICKEFKAQLEQMQSEGQETEEHSKESQRIGAEFSKLQEVLDEQNKFSHEVKQCLEEYRKKIQLLDDNARENIELIAQLA